MKGLDMRVLWLVALFFFASFAAIFLAGQFGVLRGRAPEGLGVKEGRLKRPSFNPNSVSSQASIYADHPQKDYAQIAPLSFQGDPDVAMRKLLDILKATERTDIVTQESDYLYAQCTTQLLKFTDDVEFWMDRSANIIHVRSASRLGRKDFNANRERIEKIRAQFNLN
jgi:uncharacterized protein (DUF1499 family)